MKERMEYKFFRMNMGGVVDTAQTVRLADDTAAVSHAQGFGGGLAVEIWRRDRKIATVPPAPRH